MNELAALSEIVKKEDNVKSDNKSFNDIFIANIDKYVIEIIRISEMYKFEVKIKNIPISQKKQQEKKQISKGKIPEMKNIDDFISKNEESKTAEEIRQYNIITQENINEEKSITYDLGIIKIKEDDYKVEKFDYGVKLNVNYQELKDKTGFYQERSYLTTVKVQLWPEHLPYDHFKRKRAFLFL